MKLNGGTLVVGSLTLGLASIGFVGGQAGAATPSAATAGPALVAPLNHGWIADYNNGFYDPSLPPPPPIEDSGPTGPGALPSPNVLTGSLVGSHGTYHVQVALPVGQQIVVGRTYNAGQDSMSVTVSWAGGGCTTGSYGEASFTVDAMTPASGTALAGYAVRFNCYSNSASVEGAFASGLSPVVPKQGYYTFGPDGSISGTGNNSYLVYLGSLAGDPLNAQIVGMATTPDGGGYWLVGSDGGIFAFGDAKFYGSMGAKPLNQPISGMASTADGKGYWLVATDGGIFAFGDARFQGSMGDKTLNAPIVGMAAAPGGGYWMVAWDGGIFSFGGAKFYGSMGGKPLNQAIIGMAPTPDGTGYWMTAYDGGVFSFGSAKFYGSSGGLGYEGPIVGIAPTVDGAGYWLIGQYDSFAYGDAPYFGSGDAYFYTQVSGVAS